MTTTPFDFDGDYGADYEVLARRVIPGYESLFPMVVALLDPLVPRRGRVLVVGAGTGVEVMELKSARPDLAVSGVEPSLQMLEIGRRKTEAAGLEDVTWHHGYTHELRPDPVFEGGTLINVLHFLPDDGGKETLLTDISERLVPGAPFVLFDLHGDPTSEEFVRYMGAWRRFWRLRGMDDAECREFNARIREGIHFASANRILELARDSGFRAPRLFYKSLLYGGWLFRRETD